MTATVVDLAYLGHQISCVADTDGGVHLTMSVHQHQGTGGGRRAYELSWPLGAVWLLARDDAGARAAERPERSARRAGGADAGSATAGRSSARESEHSARATRVVIAEPAGGGQSVHVRRMLGSRERQVDRCCGRAPTPAARSATRALRPGRRAGRRPGDDHPDRPGLVLGAAEQVVGAGAQRDHDVRPRLEDSTGRRVRQAAGQERSGPSAATALGSHRLRTSSPVHAAARRRTARRVELRAPEVPRMPREALVLVLAARREQRSWPGAVSATIDSSGTSGASRPQRVPARRVDPVRGAGARGAERAPVGREHPRSTHWPSLICSMRRRCPAGSARATRPTQPGGWRPAARRSAARRRAGSAAAVAANGDRAGARVRVRAPRPPARRSVVAPVMARSRSSHRELEVGQPREHPHRLTSGAVGGSGKQSLVFADSSQQAYADRIAGRLAERQADGRGAGQAGQARKPDRAGADVLVGLRV